MPTSIAPLSEELTVSIEHGGVEDVAAPSDQDIADVQMALYKALDARANGVPVANETIATLAKDSQTLAANAGPQNWGLDEISAMMDDKIGALKTELKTHMDTKFDEVFKASPYVAYNKAARRSNAAAPSDAPLVKLKKEHGSGAGTVPASPPFPVRKAELLHTITAAHIDELERFYDVKFEAMAAPEPAVGGPATSTRSTNLPQRRQQLATFLGVS